MLKEFYLANEVDLEHVVNAFDSEEFESKCYRYAVDELGYTGSKNDAEQWLYNNGYVTGIFTHY